MVSETVRGKIVELLEVSKGLNLDEIQEAIADEYKARRDDPFANTEGTIEEKVITFFRVADENDDKNRQSSQKIKKLTKLQIENIAQVWSVYCEMRRHGKVEYGKDLAERIKVKYGYATHHSLTMITRANSMTWKAAASVYNNPELEEISTKWPRPIKSIEYFYQKHMRFW